MIEKLFKNRITQENEKTINQLKRTYIEMNSDKKTTDKTPDGLFFITLQPNSYVDEITLENDFYFILKLYYRWKYGSKWTSLKHLQHKYKGIIEKQSGNHYHIHFIIYCLNMEELAIMLGYIKALFKQLYPKSSTRFERVYDIDGCAEYISLSNPNKKRVEAPIFIMN